MVGTVNHPKLFNTQFAIPVVTIMMLQQKWKACYEPLQAHSVVNKSNTHFTREYAHLWGHLWSLVARISTNQFAACSSVFVWVT